jgi:hypothetical protein
MSLTSALWLDSCQLRSYHVGGVTTKSTFTNRAFMGSPK